MTPEEIKKLLIENKIICDQVAKNLLLVSAKIRETDKIDYPLAQKYIKDAREKFNYVKVSLEKISQFENVDECLSRINESEIFLNTMETIFLLK